MQFSKKDFQKNYKPKKKTSKEIESVDDIEELYDPNKGDIGGDTVITHNQVGTDTPIVPGDKTTAREKGQSKTMDKHISQVRNPSATWGRGGEMGTYYGASGSANGVRENEIKEDSKQKMRRMVKELMNSRTKDNELINNKPDNTEKPTLDKLTGDVALQAKVEDLIKSLMEKTPEEAEIVFKYMIYNIENKEEINDKK